MSAPTAALDVQRDSILLSGFAISGLARPAIASAGVGGDAEVRTPRCERLWSYLCPHDTLPTLAEFVFDRDGRPLPRLPLGVQEMGVDEQLAQRQPVLTPIPGQSDDFDGGDHE